MPPTAPPFAATSIWNAAIPPTAAYAPAPGLSGLAAGLSTWLDPDRDSLPIYHATAADPLVPILYAARAWSGVADGSWARSGNPPGIEAAILAGSSPRFPYPAAPYASQSAYAWRLPERFERLVNPAQAPAYARVPVTAEPAPGPDGHLAVYQPDGRVLEAYAAIRLADGTLVALTYNLTDATGDGDGAQNGVTASMLPVYAGVITQAEVAGGRIDHAVKLLAPPSLLSPAYAYPALTFDRGALTEDPPYSGTLPMGARLALPPTTPPASLGQVTRLGRLLAEAAARHGFIIADRGGSGLTLAVERHVAEPELDRWSGPLGDDLNRIMGHLQLVVPGR